MTHQPKRSRILTVEQIGQKFAHLKAEVSPVQQRRVREAKARLRDDEDRAPAAPAALPAGTIRT